MAEIEHFVHPQHKETPKFDTVRDVCLTLFSREDQLGSGKTKDITIGEAVAQGMVDNETLGYFMARSFLYMRSIGIKPSLIRYRQHLRSEMAHYASDCWDLEIKTTYGWIECVGHADRACYDLEVHAERTKTPMTAAMHLEEPIVREVFEPTFDKKLVGKTFKRDQKRVIACIEQLCEENEAEVQRMDDLLSSEGSYTLAGSGEEKEGEEGNPSSVVITREMVTFAKVTKREHEEKFTPSVIEPSFGIGRILYALLEHAFSQRKEDEQRIVMRFRPSVAPVKVSFLPLMTKEPFLSVTERFCQQAIHEGHTARVDVTSAAIGRKYARSDELGIPFCVTVDGDTLVDHTVTLRERDHMSQIRLPVADVAPLLKRLCESSYEQDDWARWVAETAKYELITPPIFENGEEEEERKGGEGSGDEERKEEGAETSSSSSSSSHRSHSASLVVEKMSKARFSRPKV
jgi:glycyl-tRNA synthetase